MKPFLTLLSLVAAGLGIFGYWGLFTHSGRKQYDEMDAFYPGGALLASLILFLIVSIALIVSFFKARRKTRSENMK